MKKLVYIIAFMLSSWSYANNSVSIYQNILKDIKQSKDFEKFNSDDENVKSVFSVYPYLFNFCEFLWSQDHYSSNSPVECGEAYEFERFNSVKNRCLKKLSGKGKKSHWIYFSMTTDNYVAVTIYKNKRHWGSYDHLLYFFKVTSQNEVKMLKSEIQYIDRFQ